jgi:hypothetical protein
VGVLTASESTWLSGSLLRARRRPDVGGIAADLGGASEVQSAGGREREGAGKKEWREGE